MADEAPQGVELVIDVPALLAPIPGDKPTGANLRDDDSASSPYYDVRNTRGLRTRSSYFCTDSAMIAPLPCLVEP